MRSKKAMFAALVVSAGAVVGIGQVTNTFPIVESACSCPTPTFPPQNTVAPVASGNVQVGQGVIAGTQGTWTHTPTSYAYQWQTSFNGAGGWADLGGETGTTYTLVDDDVGTYIRIVVTATNAQGSATANSNVLGPVTASGGGGGNLTLANVWISSSGNDAGAHCTRSSTAIANPDAGGTSLCKTIPKAYSLANTGDTILIAGTSTFTTAQAFTAVNRKANGGSCYYLGSQASCITIQPASGASATFNVAGSAINQLNLLCADYVHLKNITFVETDYVASGVTLSNAAFSQGPGDSTCGASNSPHDNIYDTLTVGGQANAGGGSSSYTCVVNSTAVSTKDFPWKFAGSGNNGANAQSHHNCLIGNRFQGYNFANTDPANHHMECVTMFNDSSTTGGISNYTIRNNLFLDCPVEGIFVQIDGAKVADSNLFEGNVFKGATFPLKISCHSTGCQVTNTVVRFNTWDGAGTQFTDCNGGCTWTGSVYYGNIGMACALTGWTGSYNVYSVSSCAQDGGTSVYSKTPVYTSAGTPNYDYSLGNCSQDSAGFVAPGSVTSYPSVDYTATARPQGTNLEAGAYESCGTGGSVSTGDSLATCTGHAGTSGDPCAAGSSPAAGSGTAFPTTAGPVSGATNEVSLGNINNGTASEARGYGYYVPSGLTGAAAVNIVVPGTNGVCGKLDPVTENGRQHWHTVADQNRLIIVWATKTYNGTSCGSSAGWRHPNVDAPDPGASQASDEPYMAALVADIKTRSFGSATADPLRIFIGGASAGGTETLDVMCDTTNNALFRGFAPVSAWLQTTKSGSVQVAGTERCNPSGNGAGTSYNGGTSSPTNRNYFVVQSHGVLDGSTAYAGQCLSTHCLAGFDEESLFFKSYMSCSTGPTTTTVGTPSSENELQDYSGCVFGITPQVEMIKVPNGCHSYEGLDADPEGATVSTCSGTPSTNPTNAFDSENQIWTFFKNSQW